MNKNTRNSVLVEHGNAEHELILSAAVRLGDHLEIAEDAINGLSNLVSLRGNEFANALFAAIDNCLVLSLLSCARNQPFQAQINDRHTIELCSLLFYTIANPSGAHIAAVEQGRTISDRDWRTVAYQWFDRNLPDRSDYFKRIKKGINEAVAHGGLILSIGTFDWQSATLLEGEKVPKIEKFHIQALLLGLASLTNAILYTIKLTAEKFGGVDFHADVDTYGKNIDKKIHDLLDELIRSTPRFARQQIE